MLLVVLAVASALPAVGEPRLLAEFSAGSWIPTPLARGNNLLFVRYLPDGALLTDGEFVVPIEGKAQWWGSGVLTLTDAGFNAYDEHGKGVRAPEGTVGAADGALFIREGCTLTRVDAARKREALNLKDCVEELRFFETALAVRVAGGKTFIIRGTGAPLETGVELPNAAPRCGSTRCWVREPFKLSSVELATGQITFEELGHDPDVQSLYGDDEVFVSLSSQTSVTIKRRGEPPAGVFLPPLGVPFGSQEWEVDARRPVDGGVHFIARNKDRTSSHLFVEARQVTVPSDCEFGHAYDWVGSTPWVHCFFNGNRWHFADGVFTRFEPDATEVTPAWPDGPRSWFSVRHPDGGPELLVTDGQERRSVASMFVNEIHPVGAGVVLVKWSTTGTLWQVPYERPRGCGCDGGGASAGLLALLVLTRVIKGRRGDRRETRRPSAWS